jgi:hypothetical protein
VVGAKSRAAEQLHLRPAAPATASLPTPFLSNNQNCGRCGNSCRSGETCCRDRCVNTATGYLSDAANCGSCGKACTAGQACCKGICVDPKSWANDTTNCGGCGNVCSSGSVCCEGKCTNPTSYQMDSFNCGQCGASCFGIPCCGGQCLTKTEEGSCGGCGVTCKPRNLTCCPNNGRKAGCSNTMISPFNCGGCEQPCETKAGQTCIQGVCTACKTANSTCSSSLECCRGLTCNPSTRRCTSSGAPPALNCAAFGAACSSTFPCCSGQNMVCNPTSGVCEGGCALLDDDCSTRPCCSANGAPATCCANPGGAPTCVSNATSILNCGACGVECASNEGVSMGFAWLVRHPSRLSLEEEVWRLQQPYHSGLQSLVFQRAR